MRDTPIRSSTIVWITLAAVFGVFIIGCVIFFGVQSVATPIAASVQSSQVKQLEASIKKGVEKAIPGTPILSVTCIPDGSGNSHSTSYTCLAANKKNADGTETGLTFTGLINWDTGQYIWRIAQ